MGEELPEGIERQVRLLMEAAEGESVRAKVILFASQIDDCLKALLRRHFKPMRAKHEKEDELFRTFAPLGSFAARIATAYRLGLVSRVDADAFDVLRGIRNDCAHKILAFRFDDSPYKEAIARFVELTCSDATRAMFLGGLACPQTDEECLIWCCVMHILHLNMTLEKIVQAQDVFVPTPLGFKRSPRAEPTEGEV
jgi:hypothetical protein